MNLRDGITGGWNGGILGTIGYFLGCAVEAIGDTIGSDNKNLSNLRTGYNNGMDDGWLIDKPRYGNEHELKHWIARGGKEEDYYKYAENRHESMMSAKEDAEDLAIEEGRYDPYSGEITGWANGVYNNGMD